MISRYLILVVSTIFLSTIQVSMAKADLFTNKGVTTEASEILAGLAFFENFSEVGTSDDLRSKYNLIAAALNEAAKHAPGTPEAESALKKADQAYDAFLDSYEEQLNRLKEFTSDESFDEIFEAIDWSADEYADCVGYRGELLALLNAAASAVTADQIQDGTLNIELQECEARLNAAARKLDRLIDGWETEIQQKKDRVAELKKQHADAVAEGNTELAEQIQNEIDKLEDEEIPELEKKVNKSKKVKKSFSLEKLLQGLGKIALGILTVIFSGECGEDAQDGCKNLGIGLIADGGKDVGEAFDPPDERVNYQETVTEPATRSAEVEKKEKNIEDVANEEPTKLCCNPPDIKDNLVIVQSDEEGPLSFGYEVADGTVSKVYLIKNADGSILAEIDDSVLFFKKGADIPDVSTTLFATLNSAETQKTDGGTHLVKFQGTLKDGGIGVLGVAISPLTFSGKFKVTFRPPR